MPGDDKGMFREFKGVTRDALQREADDLGLRESDYVKKALAWQYNWIGLAGAAAFALVSGTGLPLVMAAGLELMYLALVPQSSRFRRLVRSWKYAEEKRKHDLQLARLFQELPATMRKRYDDLLYVCRTIRNNYTRLSSTSQIFVKQIEERLKGLPQAYLRLLQSHWLHTEYLRTANPESIKKEIADLEQGLAKASKRVREINERRIEILRKRVERFGSVRDNMAVIEAQCQAIEDLLELIRDQSVTLRDPQEISDQLDSLLTDVESTQQTVKEVEAIFELAAPEMASPMSATMRQRLKA
jgi:hypothetical protein